MSARLKVLISAYACEPFKGSEPEVGWQWSLQMARFHDVTVLTRANNRSAIEQGLAELESDHPAPKFVYHDLNTVLLNMKRRSRAIQLYYVLWQRSARELIKHLHEADQYDLMHHVTFAGFRYPVAVWGHGVPVVWGPIGGIESIPAQLLPWHHPLSLVRESVRNAHNLLQAAPFHVLPQRARASTMILASTPEMQRALARLGFESRLMATIGLKTSELPFQPHRPVDGPLKLLFVGNIITLKGLDLAFEALKASESNATFTLVGDGNYLPAARRQVANLRLEERVFFQCRLQRDEVLKLYANYDIFMFPSLHDTGGYAVIEAMCNELPVICLDCGGPSVAVRENCGIRVPLGPRRQVIEDLARAIRSYDRDRSSVFVHGAAARQSILKHYEWDEKGQQMHQCYLETIERHRTVQKQPAAGYSGIGGFVNFLYYTFSLRGVFAGLVVLFLTGVAGFVSVSHLKHQAGQIVDDTLPGLTYAGEAQANQAQAFNRTLMVLLSESPAQRAVLEREIATFSDRTTMALKAYSGQILERQDRLLYDALLDRRMDYLLVREKTLGLLDKSDRRGAFAMYQRELVPAYMRCKEGADKLFEYNMFQGRSRGERIMTVCTVTQFVVAGIGIFIFVVGFTMGMFK